MAEEIIIPVKLDTGPAVDTLTDTINSLKQTGQVSEDTAARYKAAQAQMTASVNNTSEATDNLSATVKQLGANILGANLKEGGEAVRQFGEKAGQAAEKMISLRAQIRANMQALAEMRLAGKAGTQQFEELQTETAKLSREMLITRGSVRSLAEEFGSFKAAAESVHLLNASMQVGTGVASMFADGNEKVEKEIRALMGVMLIANGIQEASNLLKEDSILRIKAEAAATSILTTATEFFAEASAATWAIATAGAALLLVGIVKLVEWYQNLDTATYDYKSQIENLNQAYEIQEQHIKVISSLNKSIGFNNITNELRGAMAEIDKANKSMDSFIAGMQHKFENSSKVFSEFDLEAHGKMSNTYSNMSKEDQELWEKLEKQQKEASVNLLEKEAERENQQTEIFYKGRADRVKADKNGFAQQIILFDQETGKLLAEYTNRNSQLAGFEQGKRALEDSRGKERAEMNRKENLKNEQADIEARLAMIRKGDAEEVALRIQLAGNKMRTVTTNPNASASEKNKAVQQEADEEYEIISAAANKNIAEIQAYERKYLQTVIEGFELRRNLEVKGSAEDLDLLRQENEKKLALAQVGNADMKDMNSAAYKTFMAQQEADYNKYWGDQLKAQIDADNKATDEIQKNRIKQLDIQTKYRKSQADIDKMFEDERKAHPKESDSEVYAEVDKKLKAEQDLQKEISKTAIDFAKKTEDEIFASENEARNAKYNLEISKLQKASDFELNNNNLTNAQKIAIQRKYDKEIASVKLQQWKADQKSKEEQAEINGALAVTNILATMSYEDFGVAHAIAIGAAIASTAVQVAAIAGQKPPAFAKGTPKGSPDVPAGLKLVGEHGPELINDAGGYRVVTAADTAKILSAYDIPSFTPPMPSVSDDMLSHTAHNHSGPVINEDSLAKKIAGEMAKNPVPVFNWDRNGFTTHLVNKGSKTTVVNNKFNA